MAWAITSRFSPHSIPIGLDRNVRSIFIYLLNYVVRFQLLRERESISCPNLCLAINDPVYKGWNQKSGWMNLIWFWKPKHQWISVCTLKAATQRAKSIVNAHHFMRLGACEKGSQINAPSLSRSFSIFIYDQIKYESIVVDAVAVVAAIHRQCTMA